MSDFIRRMYLATLSDDAAPLAKQFGLGLELDDFCTAVNMDEHFEFWHRRTLDFLAHSDRFVLHAPFAELCPCAIDPLVRDVTFRRLIQAAQLSRRFGIDRMVIHSGFIPRVYYPQWFLEQSAPFFQKLLDELPDDFEILIENVLDPDPQLLADLIRAIGDPRASLCLDVGHAHVSSDLPVSRWIEILSPHLRHLHLHDNGGDFDAHAVPGEGTVGFPALFSQIPPRATFTFECPDAAGCVRALQKWNLLPPQ